MTPPLVPLAQLGQWLKQTGYSFVTPTPATHARVNARDSSRESRSVEDVFGWSRPFRKSLLPGHVIELLQQAGALEPQGALLRSKVRFSTLGDRLFVHSAFPTLDPDAVFFGPDTYRFASLIRNTLATQPAVRAARILDVGCGSGAGGIVALGASFEPIKLILTDVNPKALLYAEVNATLAGVEASFRQGDLFADIDERVDLIVANPPYLVDPEARLYRHGGGELGSLLSLRIVRECQDHLAPGGRLILYTGSPIIRGRDLLREAIEEATRDAPLACTYSELDPDVFGEELAMPAYAEADRIAAVAIVLTSTRTRFDVAGPGARSEEAPPPIPGSIMPGQI